MVGIFNQHSRAVVTAGMQPLAGNGVAGTTTISIDGDAWSRATAPRKWLGNKSFYRHC